MHIGTSEPQNPNGQLLNEGILTTNIIILIISLIFHFHSYILGIDYLPFLEPEQMTTVPNMQDSSSPPITITTGLPFGNSIQRIVYVRNIIILKK